MALKYTLTVPEKAIRENLAAWQNSMAVAATAAITLAGTRIRELGRANIRASGMGKRWSDTWKVDFFPSKNALDKRTAPNPPSINAAAHVYHRIDYAEIFEDGGTVSGKPMLWIPLSRVRPRGAKTGLVGAGRITVARLKSAGVELVSLSKSGRALLGAKIPRTADGRPPNNVTLDMLKTGATLTSDYMTVPLFFGISSVSIKKRWNLRDIIATEVANLEGYYNAALKTD